MKKKLLVYIRKELEVHYDNYRKLYQKHGPEKALKKYKPFCEKRIDVNVLEFIREVKTTDPIPWIRWVDDVVSIKEDVHRKLINDLAASYLFKSKHLDVVIEFFNESVEKLSLKEREDIFKKMSSTKIFPELESKLKEAQAKLEAVVSQKVKDKQEIESLKNTIKDLQLQRLWESQIQSNVTFGGGELKIFPTESISYDFSNGDKQTVSGIGNFLSYDNLLTSEPLEFLSNLDENNRCNNCGEKFNSSSGGTIAIGFDNSRTCPSCLKKYCSICWPYSLTDDLTSSCPECSNKGD